MRNDKDNLIINLTFEFALEVIDFSEMLRNLNKFEMASQIFRSGTSIGANIREAQNAESKADFIHKFKISAKEADELEYWLKLCDESKHYPSTGNLPEKLTSIIKVISKIISVSKSGKSSNHQTKKYSNHAR